MEERPKAKDVIPDLIITAIFGGLGAISPELFREAVDNLAEQYNTDPEETRDHVLLVLRNLPCGFD